MEALTGWEGEREPHPWGTGPCIVLACEACEACTLAAVGCAGGGRRAGGVRCVTKGSARVAAVVHRLHGRACVCRAADRPSSLPSACAP